MNSDTEIQPSLIPDVRPAKGYLFCKVYLQKKSVFKSAKETEGQDQKSIVLQVGESITDTAGIIRESPCKVGDVIIHATTNKDFEGDDMIMYRFVHFAEVHGILVVDNKE